MRRKVEFKNVDPFFSSNLRKMKRDVRKLRKDSLLSEFSSHVVLGSKKNLGKISSLLHKLHEACRILSLGGVSE